MADQAFMELVLKRNPIINTYLDVLANDSMLSYKAIVQTGGKAGQTYYQHVLNGVLLLERLRDPWLSLDLKDHEIRCLYAAYTVHDINKIPPYSEQRASYATLATDENVAQELRQLGIARFFPEWEEFLPDIAALARLHQAHLGVTSQNLDRRETRRSRLGTARREQLAHLIRAVDAIDLSHTLDADERHKATFLRELNAARDQGRWRFLTHQLVEQRGLLANLIHNAVVTTMRERFKAIDLLYYADGVAYLVAEKAAIVWGDAELMATAQAVEGRLAEIQREKLGQFIKGSNTGIQVDAAALESGAGYAGILAQIRATVESPGGTYSAKSVAKRETDVRANDLPSALARATDPLLRGAIEDLLVESTILPRDEASLQRAYLIDAYRNLLSRHLEAILKQRKLDSWTHTYDLLGAAETQRCWYDSISSGRRAYFMVRDVTLDFDVLYELLVRDVLDLAGESGQARDQGFIAAYIGLHLNVQGVPAVVRDFQAPLRRYVADQHRQCCYCGNADPSNDWMSANAPPSLNVQLFSARLEGGNSTGPKRMICPICRTQFILEKLAWAAHRDKRASEQATYYLHLFPKTFLTAPFLEAWRNGLERLHAEETDASFFIDVNAFFRKRAEGASAREAERIDVTVHKVNGIALPKLQEAIGNVPVLALNAPGKTQDAQFLLTLEKALILRRFFPSRVVVTRSPVPPLVPTEATCLLLDGVPRSMSWLVPEPELDDRAIGYLLARLAALHEIGRRLYQPKTNESPMLDLIRAADDDPLALYYAADRLIKRKVSGPNADLQALRLTRAIAPHLKMLLASSR